MSDLRQRDGDAGAIDPDGDDFAAQFDREFGPPSDRGRVDERRRRHEADVDGDVVTTAPTPTGAAPRTRRCPRGSGCGSSAGPTNGSVGRGPTTASSASRSPSSTLVVTTFIMMRVVHFRPILGDDLIFDDVTPTGGDMGAHVWAPAFLRDHLLPNCQLSGWSMDWYGGLPVYRFYMVSRRWRSSPSTPCCPYGVAFKLVAIFGLVTLPFMCWAFGRLARFRYPMPELFAFAGLVLRAQREHDHLRRQRAGDDGRRVLVLDRLSLMMLGFGLLAAASRTASAG